MQERALLSERAMLESEGVEKGWDMANMAKQLDAARMTHIQAETRIRNAARHERIMNQRVSWRHFLSLAGSPPHLRLLKPNLESGIPET